MAIGQKKIGVASGVAVGIIFCRTTDRIILVENIAHRTPMKKMPGGTIELGETAEDALLREIRQETLLEVDKSDVNFLFEHVHPIYQHSFWVFVCTVENFDYISQWSIPDGEELLMPRAYSINQITRMTSMVNNGRKYTQDGRLVPIHKEMLSRGLQMIYEELNADCTTPT